MALHMGDYLQATMQELRVEPLHRRIRCSVNGETVCDTTDAMLVWEPRRVVPMYAVPEADIRARLTPGDPVPLPEDLPPVLGPARFALHVEPGQPLTVHAGGQVFEGAAFRPDDPDLGGRVILEWSVFDWTEEGQPVLGHPHDPFKRIDILAGDRHIVVSYAGTVLAETKNAVALYETHLPVRWYIPAEDVDMSKLEPSEHATVCAYKGQASYHSVAGAGVDGRNIAWTYRDPLHEAAQIKDLVCFYSERTDLSVDGVDVPRPVTLWSPPRRSTG